MKFKITITKEVIDKSLMCGVDENMFANTNCALAVAYTEIVPNVAVTSNVRFPDECDRTLAIVSATWPQLWFIGEFDEMCSSPPQRYSLVGQQFDVEIPDSVIEYWYGDVSKAAQKIIDNPIMQLV